MAPDSSAILDLGLWDSLPQGAREACARRIGESLPLSFEYLGVSTFSLGGQAHAIAVFAWEDAEFVLVPGSAPAILGYDRAAPFVATTDQAEDWAETESEYGISLHDYLDHYLSPLREVRISPMLVEVSTHAVTYAQEGNDQTEGYQRALATFRDGYRLPTADEWEYLCSGGARTLFRWGDSCPITCSYDEKRWTLHQQRNAFGIELNASTYDSELCSGPALLGGDGGCTVCGGMGNVASWLPFASAFRVPQEEINDWWIDEVFVRRVLTVET